MAGCSAHNAGGDNDAAKKRIANWAKVWAVLGALVTFGALASALGAVVGGPVALLAVLAILIGAAAGAALGFFIGQTWDWFTRLKKQSPETITITGLVRCAGKNPWGLQPWTDGDWTFNIGQAPVTSGEGWAVLAPAGLDMNQVRTRAAPKSGLAQAFPSFNEPANAIPILHCEISSRVGSYGVVGGAIGSVAGAIAGGIIGAAICVGLSFVTFGLAAVVCALIVAALILAGAAGGGLLGEAIGSAIGALADALSDFDKKGEAIRDGCMVTITGTWVTDTSHQHNEIHDIEAMPIAECGVGSTASGLGLAAAVGIARHPSGPDP